MLRVMLRVTHHPSGEALLRHARSLLEASEAENGLMLGLCAAAAHEARAEASASLWISIDAVGAGCFAAALRTPPFNIVLSRAPREAIEALVEDLAARGVPLPGVVAPLETAGEFAARWIAAHGGQTKVTMRQGIYEVTAVVAPSPRATGVLRNPRADEVERLAAWAGDGFVNDTGLPDAEREPFRRRVAACFAEGSLFVWDNGGEAVSMAALQGETTHGVRVSMVYTPPERRGHGYASACVAALSARALASGRRFCMLYTDLANPTSNKIYKSVGYRFVGESQMIAFVA